MDLHFRSTTPYSRCERPYSYTSDLAGRNKAAHRNRALDTSVSDAPVNAYGNILLHLLIRNNLSQSQKSAGRTPRIRIHATRNPPITPPSNYKVPTPSSKKPITTSHNPFNPAKTARCHLHPTTPSSKHPRGIGLTALAQRLKCQ